MHPLYQKYTFEEHFPFNIYITDNIEFPPHWHEDYEIIYNLDEPFEITIGDEMYSVEHRDIVIVSGNVVHSFICQPKPRQRIILQFNPDLLGMYSDFDKHIKIVNPLIKSGTTHDLLEEQILTIERENRQKQNGYKLTTMARLYDLVSIFVRNVDTDKCSEDEVNNNRSRLARLDKVFTYIDKNYGKKISLDKISEIAGYSTYHFTRFFKDATCMTFVTYLNNYRIYKASVMLMETEERITDIAYGVGYESVKTFNRVFKELKKISPTEYRKQNMRSE